MFGRKRLRGHIHRSGNMEAEIYQKAIDKFGLSKQEDMLIEEMAELTQAILKYRRNPNGKTLRNVHEEFVDVEIVMKQMGLLLDDSTLFEIKAEKLNRLKDLINGK